MWCRVMESLRPMAAIVAVGLVCGGSVRAAEPAPTCAAATPTPNPWTKRSPPGWWMKRHEEILAAPRREEARIAFIGDSITDSWDAEGAGLAVWEREFGPLAPLNLGVNCDSTQHVLWRLDNGELDGLPNLEAVVIQIGTNNVGITRDSPEDIAAGVAAICDRVRRKAPRADILVMAIFPKAFGAQRHDEANGLLAKLADGDRVRFMDINESLVTGQGIADRVGHLNEQGFAIWAERILPIVARMLEESSAARRP